MYINERLGRVNSLVMCIDVELLVACIYTMPLYFLPLSAASPPQEREVVFLPPTLEEESLPSDLFSVLFKCEAHDTPWRSLLVHAVALQRPLLAILAACYEVGVCVCVCICMCTYVCASIFVGVCKECVGVWGRCTSY